MKEFQPLISLLCGVGLLSLFCASVPGVLFYFAAREIARHHNWETWGKKQ